jgi:SNF2 family DNA or RNA helicase
MQTISAYKEFINNVKATKSCVDELPENASDLLRSLVNRILSENSEAKVLVFSVTEEFLGFLDENRNVKLGFVKGQATHIAKVIDSYKRANNRPDSLNTLILHAWYTMAGLNLENTTDVIFFHEVNEARACQAIGRANRPGRDISNILNVHYIVPKEQ